MEHYVHRTVILQGHTEFPDAIGKGLQPLVWDVCKGTASSRRMGST